LCGELKVSFFSNPLYTVAGTPGVACKGQHTTGFQNALSRLIIPNYFIGLASTKPYRLFQNFRSRQKAQ
jgi:hypothetical protein